AARESPAQEADRSPFTFLTLRRPQYDVAAITAFNHHVTAIEVCRHGFRVTQKCRERKTLSCHAENLSELLQKSITVSAPTLYEMPCHAGSFTHCATTAKARGRKGGVCDGLGGQLWRRPWSCSSWAARPAPRRLTASCNSARAARRRPLHAVKTRP